MQGRRQNRDEQERGERAEQSYDTLLARRVRTDIECAHVYHPRCRGATSKIATMMTNATAAAYRDLTGMMPHW